MFGENSQEANEAVKVHDLLLRRTTANLDSRHFVSNVADSGEAATDHAGCLQVNVERQAKLSHADSRGEATDELGETNLKRKRLQVIGGNKSDLLPGAN